MHLRTKRCLSNYVDGWLHQRDKTSVIRILPSVTDGEERKISIRSPIVLSEKKISFLITS